MPPRTARGRGGRARARARGRSRGGRDGRGGRGGKSGGGNGGDSGGATQDPLGSDSSNGDPDYIPSSTSGSSSPGSGVVSASELDDHESTTDGPAPRSGVGAKLPERGATSLLVALSVLILSVLLALLAASLASRPSSSVIPPSIPRAEPVHMHYTTTNSGGGGSSTPSLGMKSLSRTEPPHARRFAEFCSITTQWVRNHLGPEKTLYEMVGLPAPSVLCLRQRGHGAAACYQPRHDEIMTGYHVRAESSSACLCRQSDEGEEVEVAIAIATRAAPAQEQQESSRWPALFNNKFGRVYSKKSKKLVCPSVAPDAERRCTELSLATRAVAVLLDSQASAVYLDEFLPLLMVPGYLEVELQRWGKEYDSVEEEEGLGQSKLSDETGQEAFERHLATLCG